MVQVSFSVYCDNFEDISDLMVFLNASAGHWKRRGGPLFAQPWLKDKPTVVASHNSSNADKNDFQFNAIGMPGIHQNLSWMELWARKLQEKLLLWSEICTSTFRQFLWKLFLIVYDAISAIQRFKQAVISLFDSCVAFLFIPRVLFLFFLRTLKKKTLGWKKAV